MNSEPRDEGSGAYAILDHVPHGCVVMRGDGQTVFWNQAIEQATGLARDTVVGKDLFELFPRLGESRYRLRIEQTLLLGAPSVFSALLHVPIFHLGKGSVERSFEQVILTRTTNRSAKAHEVLFTVTDLTEQHRRGEKFKAESRRATAEAEMRRAREAELQVATEIAKAATCAKSHFLAAMSHEIRTPMNGVLGMCDVLLHSTPTPAQREHLEILHASASGLLTVLNDILDFSKIEANKLELEEIAYDPGRIVEECICLIAEMPHVKDVECISVVAPDVPASVIGDPTRFRQVLMNLLSNAVKFTASGEVIAQLTVRSEGEGLVLRCAVRDTGPGMTKETCAKLFAPFVQATGATSREHGGTGLGLTICRQLVRLMGGEIELKSELGSGSEFTFEVRVAAQLQQASRDRHDIRVGIAMARPSAARSLAAALESYTLGIVRLLTPADLATPERIAGLTHILVDALSCAAAGLAGGPPTSDARFILVGRPSFAVGTQSRGFARNLSFPCRRSALEGLFDLVPRAPVPEAPVRASLKGLRVLVAEDNRTNQIVARSMLSKLGCEVRVVDDGREAVNVALSEPFDIILMDMQMPIVDGLKATDLLRQSGHGGPIIALTASALAEDRAACRSAGMDDFLAKPIERPALVSMLERWGVHRAAAQASVEVTVSVVPSSAHELLATG